MFEWFAFTCILRISSDFIFFISTVVKISCELRGVPLCFISIPVYAVMSDTISMLNSCCVFYTLVVLVYIIMSLMSMS